MSSHVSALKTFVIWNWIPHNILKENQILYITMYITLKACWSIGPITSWQIDGETMETVTDFLFLGSKITADGDCSHEIKRHLLFGRKTMTNLDIILKSRDITLLTKVHIVKPMVFPVVICGCESWTIKKAEYQRIDAFELWCRRRLLRVPWTARFLKEISPDYSLEGQMLKLKLQYLGHVMWRTDSLEKTLMLGKSEGRRRGQWRMRWLDGITTLSKLQQVVKHRGSWYAVSGPWGCKESDTAEQLNKITYKVLPFHASHYYKQ